MSWNEGMSSMETDALRITAGKKAKELLPCHCDIGDDGFTASHLEGCPAYYRDEVAIALCEAKTQDRRRSAALLSNPTAGPRQPH